MKARCEICGHGSSFLVKVNGRPERRCMACIAKVRAQGVKLNHLERMAS